SPKVLLSHRSPADVGGAEVAAFVSHCGDTSVYESVEALVPIVGIPLFADQPDMCARIVDAGVGVRVDKHALEIPTTTTKTSSKNSKNVKENEETLAIEMSPLYKAIREVLLDR
ncbi:hypothetical protein COY87_03625, partial [Candidatus Roizmanbacteria bacterium CG_4_10_14_0_8_um_filter_33_9]